MPNQDAPALVKTSHGGRRAGAGRKTKEVEALTHSSLIEREANKARLEKAKADKAEHDFQVQIGLYVEREAVRGAQAKAFSAVAQSLRSIPDVLERKLGVSPDVAERVGQEVDSILSTLADTMESMHDGF